VANASQLTAARTAFRRALHVWYRAHRRRLPWREAPSLYRTVVSEFMLQQTQVATVLPYFDRWLRALPDFAALAAASEAQVLKLWEGLGYYSRARNLRRLAQALAARPEPPRPPAEWRALPGVGPYTAAAIASIAFGVPAACVDGNVVRVLARLTGERRRFRDGAAAAKHFAASATALVAGANPGLHNQAMMELGATICVRAKPACAACPVARFCAAHRAGDPEKLPRLRPKPTEERAATCLWILRDGRLLLRRGHTHARRLAGLHELPEATDLGLAPSALDRRTLLIRKRRTITRHRIIESIHAPRLTAAQLARAATNPALEWVPLTALDEIALSGPHRRWVRELLRLV
jgi:A/G-specific adenine glycosylase